jgi:hypothetical protein
MNAKKLFHRRARAFLNELATEVLKLTPDRFEVRTNEAGPAVMGETVLHTDPIKDGKGLYVMVSVFSGPSDRKVLMRTCNGRKDYTGGRNNMLTLDQAVTLAKAFMNGSNFFQVQ